MVHPVHKFTEINNEDIYFYLACMLSCINKNKVAIVRLATGESATLRRITCNKFQICKYLLAEIPFRGLI
jgi:hypothetical protein